MCPFKRDYNRWWKRILWDVTWRGNSQFQGAGVGEIVQRAECILGFMRLYCKLPEHNIMGSTDPLVAVSVWESVHHWTWVLSCTAQLPKYCWHCEYPLPVHCFRDCWISNVFNTLPSKTPWLVLKGALFFASRWEAEPCQQHVNIYYHIIWLL